MSIRLAEAYENAAEALAALALEIRATTPQDAPGAAPAVSTAPSFDDLPLDEYDAPVEQVAATPHGSLAMCPAHHTAYRDGKYGPYCPQSGTDPKWTNDRGYCQITPAKAAAYLRQKAKAAA